MPDPDFLDRSEIHKLVREEISANVPTSVDLDSVVRTSVHETLVTLGMDAQNPLDLQQDMAFLREMRQAHNRIRTKGVLVLVGLVITSLATLVWMGLKASMHQ